MAVRDLNNEREGPPVVDPNRDISNLLPDREAQPQFRQDSPTTSYLAYMLLAGGTFGGYTAIRHFAPSEIKRAKEWLEAQAPELIDKIEKSFIGRNFNFVRQQFPEGWIPGQLQSKLGALHVGDLDALRELDVLLKTGTQQILGGTASSEQIKTAILEKFNRDIPQTKGSWRGLRLKDIFDNPDFFRAHLGRYSRFTNGAEVVPELQRITGLSEKEIEGLSVGEHLFVKGTKRDLQYMSTRSLSPKHRLAKAAEGLRQGIKNNPLLDPIESLFSSLSKAENPTGGGGFNPVDLLLPTHKLKELPSFAHLSEEDVRSLLSKSYKQGIKVFSSGRFAPEVAGVFIGQGEGKGIVKFVTETGERAQIKGVKITTRKNLQRIDMIRRGFGEELKHGTQLKGKIGQFLHNVGFGPEFSEYPSVIKKVGDLFGINKALGIKYKPNILHHIGTTQASGERFFFHKGNELKLGAHGVVEAVSRLPEQFGIGIRPAETIVGQIGKHIALAGALYVGFQALQYADFLTGRNASGLVTGAYGKGRVGIQKVLEATGITDIAKSIENVTPGLIESPLSKGVRAIGSLYLGTKIGTEIGHGKAGVIAGAALGLLNLLDVTESSQNLSDIYSGERPVPVRSGAGWILGRTPFEGGKIRFYAPTGSVRYHSAYKEKSIYGSEANYWKYGTFLPTPSNLFGLTPLFNPYFVEKQHYYDRPFPTTGTFGEEIPIIGPLFATTFGRALKPIKRMHVGEGGIQLYSVPGFDTGRKGIEQRPFPNIVTGEPDFVPMSPLGPSHDIYSPPKDAGTTKITQTTPATVGTTNIDKNIHPLTAGTRKVGFGKYDNSPKEIKVLTREYITDRNNELIKPESAGVVVQPEFTAPLSVQKGVVMNVIDADTVDLMFANGSTDRIRFSNYNAPETSTKEGVRQLVLLNNALKGKEVTLKRFGRGIHGRTLGKISVNGKDVGDMLNRLQTQVQDIAVDPYSLSQTLDKTFYRTTEFIGLRGYLAQVATKALTGNSTPFAGNPQLASSSIITSTARSYFDIEPGGLFGNTEYFRRLLPRPQNEQEKINFIQNTNPSYLPGKYSSFSPDITAPIDFTQGGAYCLSANTLVETKGLVFKRAENINYGDILISADGEYTEVTDIFIREPSDTLNIKINSLSAFPIICSKDHPFLVRNTVKGRSRKPRNKLYKYANDVLKIFNKYKLTGESLCKKVNIHSSTLSFVWKLLERYEKVSINRSVYPMDIKIIDPTPFDHNLIYRGLEFVKAKDLKIGQYVVYPRIELKETINQIDMSELNAWRAVTQNYVYYNCSQQHAENWEYLIGETDFIGDKSILHQARRTKKIGCSPKRFPRFIELTNDLGKFVGLWCAEGWANINNGACGTAHHIKEEKIIKDIYTGVNISGQWRPSNVSKGVSMTFGSRGMAKLLVYLCNKGAKTKQLNKDFINYPKVFIRGFLDGLFFGDGCEFETNNRRIKSLKSTSWNLILQVRKLLLGLGEMSSVVFSPPSKNPSPQPLNKNKFIKSGPSWDLKIHGDGTNFYNCEWFCDDKYFYLRIKDIKKDKYQQTFGFTTEKSTFCAIGVATHNSKIPLGEARLPGAGREALHKLTSGIPGYYNKLDRFLVLADVAPYSAAFKTFKQEVQKQILEGQYTNKQAKQFYDALDRVKSRYKKANFNDFKEGGHLLPVTITLGEHVGGNRFKPKQPPKPKKQGFDIANENILQEPLEQKGFLTRFFAPKEVGQGTLDQADPLSVRGTNTPIEKRVVRIAGIDASDSNITRNFIRGLNQEQLDKSESDKSIRNQLATGASPLIPKHVSTVQHKIQNLLNNAQGQTVTGYVMPTASGKPGEVELFVPELAEAAKKIGAQSAEIHPIQKQLEREHRSLLSKTASFVWHGATHFLGEAGVIGGGILGFKKSKATTLSGKLLSTGVSAILGGIIGGHIEQKALTKYNPIEHYRNYQVYGTDFAGWDRPYQNFIRPWATTAASKLKSSTWIPKWKQKERDIEEYFDKLEYVKWRSLETQALKQGEVGLAAHVFGQQRRQTLVGQSLSNVNIYNPNLRKALPKKEAIYFDAFSQATDSRTREAIIKSVPDYMGVIYTSIWAKNKPKNVSFDSSYVQQFYDHVTKRENALGSDAVVAEYFSKHALPDKDFIGWHPEVNLDDVKLKTIENEGLDAHAFGLWENQSRQISQSKPYIHPITAETLSSPIAANYMLEALRNGIDSPQVSVLPSYTYMQGNGQVDTTIHGSLMYRFRSLLGASAPRPGTF